MWAFSVAMKTWIIDQIKHNFDLNQRILETLRTKSVYYNKKNIRVNTRKEWCTTIPTGRRDKGMLVTSQEGDEK